MIRKVLLLEPNYRNKYPPMGLMKLATYYRNRGDDVRFFKGDLLRFGAELLCEEFFNELENSAFCRYFHRIVDSIKSGKLEPLRAIPDFEGTTDWDTLQVYRKRFKNRDFPHFDLVCITTLFTFYWKETIDTINRAKLFCESPNNIIVGGIASSIVPDSIKDETGINPIKGLLDKPGILDENDNSIIDELPLDYSILDEIDYHYPTSDAYFAYMTRGCTRKCPFCAVPKLEPVYKSYISLKEQIAITDSKYGQKRNLLLMDNNVLASKCFDRIIDEIKDCGFSKDSRYCTPNQYQIAITNLKNELNNRAYIKKMLSIYEDISKKLNSTEQGEFYILREEAGCLSETTATRESIIKLDSKASALYKKTHTSSNRMRYVDFNQGIDARLVTQKKMARLAELNIKPLRIAFDDYSMKDIYINAIDIAVQNGIKELSNYLLYNYTDEPVDLYRRLKLNVELCEKHNVGIYSFPMKYHPIDNPDYFRNRDYLGRCWEKKFIRTVQAVLNSTKGKIGRGVVFFEKAFGKDEEEFFKILYMPEAMIIYRLHYEKTGQTEQWWGLFQSLDEIQREEVLPIIHESKFSDYKKLTRDPTLLDLLSYYAISRDDAEKEIKGNISK